MSKLVFFIVLFQGLKCKAELFINLNIFSYLTFMISSQIDNQCVM